MKKAKKEKLGPLHYHEALDRTYIISYMIDDWLVQHPAIAQNKKFLKKAEKAAFLLADLYQDIGQINYDKIDKK